MKGVWIIIPAYNERKHIEAVIKDSKKYGTVVVVDDGSRDGTADVVGKRYTVLRHLVNLGKGAALKTGCDYAVNQGAEILVALDADGQHRAGDIPQFVKALEKVDIVFGYRRLNRSMPFVLKVGNFLLTETTKLLYGVDLQDTQCGFRVFTVDTYRKIRWTVNDYSMESEMIANVGKKGLRYAQVPIETVYSDKYKGTTVLDGLKIMFNMFIWRFARW